LKGTFVRNAWDFYEVGAAWLFGSYTPATGTTGFVFINNAIAQSYLDVFRAEFSCSEASSIGWSIAAPGAQYTPIEPSIYFNRPVALDQATPPGDMAVWTAPPTDFSPILKQRMDSTGHDVIELATGGPFLTLPPLYGLAVRATFTTSGFMSLSVWYQSITDHVPPPT
jgi:hypothetical protein